MYALNIALLSITKSPQVSVTGCSTSQTFSAPSNANRQRTVSLTSNQLQSGVYLQIQTLVVLMYLPWMSIDTSNEKYKYPTFRYYILWNISIWRTFAATLFRSLKSIFEQLTLVWFFNSHGSAMVATSLCNKFDIHYNRRDLLQLFGIW